MAPYRITTPPPFGAELYQLGFIHDCWHPLPSACETHLPEDQLGPSGLLGWSRGPSDPRHPGHKFALVTALETARAPQRMKV
jgi:hypothetical protein